MVFVAFKIVTIFFFQEGNKYTGPRDSAGLAHGQGRLVAANGDQYEGGFKHGKFDGEGVYRFKRSAGVYKGEFKDGKFHGRGKESYHNGSHYDGEYRNGERNGKGLMVYRNGSSYEGEWVKGMKEGKGKMDFAGKDGKTIEQTYIGEFKNGKRHGRGKLRTKTHRVEGEFRDGKPYEVNEIEL